MDLRRADLGLLIALDALLATHSVTAAAARLGISQPALSAQLARLRDLFGDALLVPSGRRMVPTARAETLREPLHRLLADLDGLMRDGRDFDPRRAELVCRIAATDWLLKTLCLPMIDRLSREAPGIRMALHPHDPRQAWRQLEEGELDLVIGSNGMTPPEAQRRKLFAEDFVMVQRRGHPRGPGPVTLDAYCALGHVLVSPDGGGLYGAVDRALAQLDRTRRVMVSLPSFLLVPSALAGSDLVAALPRQIAIAFRATLDMVELPLETPCFDVLLAWHPRRQEDPAHRWLREAMAQSAAVHAAQRDRTGAARLRPA